MQTTKVKKTPIGKKAELSGLSTLALSRTYGSDGPMMYWLEKLDDYRRTSETLINIDLIKALSNIYV